MRSSSLHLTHFSHFVAHQQQETCADTLTSQIHIIRQRDKAHRSRRTSVHIASKMCCFVGPQSDSVIEDRVMTGLDSALDSCVRLEAKIKVVPAKSDLTLK